MEKRVRSKKVASSIYLFGIGGIGRCMNLAIEDITWGRVARPGEPAAISLTPGIKAMYYYTNLYRNHKNNQ